MMNQRIQALARTAGLGFHGESITMTQDELPETVLGRFAELIVQECIERINRVGILEDVEFQSGMIAQDVREHFGVE